MARANLNATAVPKTADWSKSNWTAQQARGASPVLFSPIATLPVYSVDQVTRGLPKSTTGQGLDLTRFPDIWFT